MKQNNNRGTSCRLPNANTGEQPGCPLTQKTGPANWPTQ